MVLKCTECETVIDADEKTVYGQMVAHMRGSHGITAGESDFKLKPIVMVEPVAEKIAKIEQPTRTFIKPKKSKKIWKR